MSDTGQQVHHLTEIQMGMAMKECYFELVIERIHYDPPMTVTLTEGEFEEEGMYAETVPFSRLR